MFLFPTNPNDDELNLQLRILNNYADMLFSTKGMWDIAIDYYLASGMDSVMVTIDERLQTLDWNDDVVEADIIISTCDRYGFYGAKAKITREVTEMYYKLLHGFIKYF